MQKNNLYHMRVKTNARLACIPCGMMGELLYLDYQNIDHICFTVIDYDANALLDAQALAEKQNASSFVKFIQQDAAYTLMNAILYNPNSFCIRCIFAQTRCRI